MEQKDLQVALKIGVKDEASKKLGEISKEVKNISLAAAGLAAAGFAFTKLSASIAKSVEPASRFNRELMRISLTADDTTNKVKELYNSIYNNAQRTGVSKENLMQGYNALAAGGYSVEEIKSVMGGVSKAMVVSTASAEQLSNAVMVAANSFGIGLNADNSTAMLDKFYQAGKLGNAELEDLSLIISRIGTSAKLAGLNLNETLAFVETMAASKEGAEVVSTMGDAFLRMFNDASLRKNITKMTGARFFNEDGSRGDFLQVMRDIKESYAGRGSDLERSQFIETAFGGADLRTKRAIARILEQDGSVENMGAMMQAIADANGVVEKDAKEFEKNYSFQSDKLKQTLERARTSAGNLAANLLTSPTKLINDVLGTGDYGGALATTAVAAGLLTGGLTMHNAGKLGKLGGLGTNFFKGQAAEKLGIQQVFVTNMPPVMSGFDKMPMALSKLSVGVNALGAAAIGYAVGETINQSLNSATNGEWNNMTFGLEKPIGAILDLFDPQRRKNKKLASESEGVLARSGSLRTPSGDYNYLNSPEFQAKLSAERYGGTPNVGVNVSVVLDKDGRLIDTKKFEQTTGREY